MSRKIAIVGLGSAGFAALLAIKKLEPKAEVVVIDPKPSDLFHPCGIPYALEGIVSFDSLMQNVVLKQMGVTKIVGNAEVVDWKRKTIGVRTLDGVTEIPYDAAIIATGYKPHIPPIRNIEKFLHNVVHTVSSFSDIEKINKHLKAGNSAIVIGGGAIGIEVAYALKRRGLLVTIVEMKPQLLWGVLDADMAALLENHLAVLGIDYKLNTQVDEICGDAAFVGVKAGENTLSANVCIIAAGFLPNDDVAKKSDIQTENFGISVNSLLSTSAPNVFAAGDCIAAWSIIDGKKIPTKLATSAYKQGTIAGSNACGQMIHYRGTAGTFVTKIGDLEIAKTGYTALAALNAGFDPVWGKINSRVVPEYFPKEGAVTIKIIADKNSGKILGAQAIGDGAGWRINIISAALEYEIALDKLPSLELAYCPSVSEVYDPLLRAIDFTLRKLKR